MTRLVIDTESAPAWEPGATVEVRLIAPDIEHTVTGTLVADTTPATALTAEQRALLIDAVEGAASIGLHFPALCHAFGLPDTIGPSLDAARSLPVGDDTPSLDAAWKAAEAALPEGWWVEKVYLRERGTAHETFSAWARRPDSDIGGLRGDGDTPSAALLALTAT